MTQRLKYEVSGKLEQVPNALLLLARQRGLKWLTICAMKYEALALRRQMPLQRFKPLDRLMVARPQLFDGISGDFRVTADPTRSGLGRFVAVREQSLASRLMTLHTMGLAPPHGHH
jgi:hypothetical protein